MLHAGILVTINIPIFGELMWVGYLAFLTPPEFNALLRAIDLRRFFRRPSSEATSEALPELAPIFRPASILVRLEAPSSLMGPYRIDVVPPRALDEAEVRMAH